MKKFITLIFICFVSAIYMRSETVMMVGDSHVAGRTYPQTVGSILTSHNDACDFHYFGINGAAFTTFCKPENLDTIFKIKPDILIVHLGTNDSYAHKFNPSVFKKNLNNFYILIHDSLPEIKMVFVTPFVNKNKRKIRSKNKRGKTISHTVWEINNNTRTCSEVIDEFCKEHPDDTYIVDNNASHGMDFLNNGLISRDFVHLTKAGYEMLGQQVGEELIQMPEFSKSKNEE